MYCARGWTALSSNLGRGKTFFSIRQIFQTGFEVHLQLLFYLLFCMGVKLGLSY